VRIDEASAAAERTIREFWEAAQHRDVETLARLFHPEAEMAWPQSGERFVGRDNVLGAIRAQDESPEIVGASRLIGGGDVWVAMVPLRYGADDIQYVAIYEMADGLVIRATAFFGTAFPAKPARARYAEPVTRVP
jgi:hypothetical protein